MRLPGLDAVSALGLALLAALWSADERPAALQAGMRGASAWAAPATPAEPLRDPMSQAQDPENEIEQERSSAARRPVRSEPRAGAPAPMRVDRLIVRGRVRGPFPDLERAALESRRDVGRSTISLRGRCTVDGSYEIDATELLDQRLRTQGNGRFELDIAHPDCTPVLARFELGAGEFASFALAR